MKCPRCEGAGQVFAIVCGPGVGGPRHVGCRRCDGKGVVGDEVAGWITDGDELRRLRHYPYRDQREMAGLLGCSTTELSQAENGMVNPMSLLIKARAVLRPLQEAP